ncbi:DUF5658 family protein [Desulfosporosinus youngiae]|uniref:DUF5658 domain-containing protein n=1 Tax=Desulfosporosinus youngiae DSM 17734 TaxID=768710 RepID=H5XUC3_9FIRM|nr:DUF5658 family protein [Desulfosporosinus youngiae]EHQ89359.1 hypothetical protein DesyoDRAFT_2276 [Desulfosporosinus youngiae DSM 17734]
MKVYERRIIFASGILFILNALDGLLTFWGLNLKVIEEANPLMRGLITMNPSSVICAKLLLPLFMGVICWIAREQSQRLVKYSLSLVLVIYLLTNLLHLYWWLNL